MISLARGWHRHRVPAGPGRARGREDRRGHRAAPALVAADAIRDIRVRDRAGQDVGSIDRVIVHRRTGEIQHLILGAGGLLGFGRDHLQLLWADLALEREDATIVARVDRDTLDRAPAIDRAWFDRAWDPGAPRPDPRAEREPVTPRVGAPVAPAPDVAEIAADLIAEDVLVPSPVHDARGHEIGTLERLMIDPRQGRVRYAVVGAGGFLGIGRDQLLVPWELLRVEWDGGRLVVVVAEGLFGATPRAAVTAVLDPGLRLHFDAP